MDQISNLLNTALELAIRYVPKVLLSIVLLVVGFKIIRKISSVTKRALKKTSFNREIISFIASLTDIGLKVLLILLIAGVAGFDLTALVAVLAAAGFAIGLAWQGSLGNFAAGIIILVFRPYKAGDWISIQDKFGKVEEVQIFNTIIVTPGRKTLIIPNGQIIEGIVTNFSTKGFIRIELTVTMPYGESFPRVQEIISKTLLSIPNVLKDPPPEVGIEQFDSHSVVLTVRPYVYPDDYWPVTFEAYERIKRAFHENEIQVAYSEGIEMGKIGA